MLFHKEFVELFTFKAQSRKHPKNTQQGPVFTPCFKKSTFSLSTFSKKRGVLSLMVEFHPSKVKAGVRFPEDASDHFFIPLEPVQQEITMSSDAEESDMSRLPTHVDFRNFSEI
ncbi:hypothetical protein AB4K20DRAFT_1872095 [Rhizopus microsporus]